MCKKEWFERKELEPHSPSYEATSISYRLIKLLENGRENTFRFITYGNTINYRTRYKYEGGH